MTEYRPNIFLDNSLRAALEAKSKGYGFASVDDVIRFMVNSFLQGNIGFGLISTDYAPMVDEETEKAVAQGMKDIKAGNYTSVDPSQSGFMKEFFKDV
jgi:type III secretory pathway component EscV